MIKNIVKSKLNTLGAHMQTKNKNKVGAGPVSAQIDKNNANIGAVWYATQKINHTPQNGITLISLVITIIILLILAGVTLSITMGENGLFNTAKKAGEETKKQAALETMNIRITNIQALSYAEKQRMPTLQELADKLYEDNEIEYISILKQTSTIIKEKITVGESTSIYTKLKQYPYEFEIDNSLKIKSIDGVEVSSDENADQSQENTGSDEGITGEIPEGYIKPSGTKEIVTNGEHDVTAYEKVNVNVPTYEPNSTLSITTKSDKVDVSRYQYADTTGLYTKDQVQSGEGVYWDVRTQVFPTNSKTMVVNLGYNPKFIFVKVERDTGEFHWYSYDSGTTFYRCNTATGETGIVDTWSITDGKLVMTVSSTMSQWEGKTYYIYTIK